MSDSGTPPQDPNAQPDPYGQPNPYGPPDPSGQPPPYGQPGTPPFGQQAPYGQPGYQQGYQPGYQQGYPQPPYGQQAYPPRYPYSHWIKRVGARLIDGLIAAAIMIPAYIGLVWALSDLETTTDQFGNSTTTGDVQPGGIVLMIVFALASIAFSIWNVFIRQGRTGYSIGKSVLGIKLISEVDGQPIGGAMAFVREICHILDGFCYIGYLWPLWDAKRQTFADKIIKTVVIDQPT